MGDHIAHVGLHKTGSTWLQHHVFPTVSGAVCIPARDEKPLVLSLIRDESFDERRVRAVIDSMGRRVLLSSEKIARDLWSDSTNADRTAARLHGIMPQARVIIVVRRQQDLLRSIYAQYVNEGGTVSFRRFVNGQAPRCGFSLDYLDFAATVRRYDELFERVLVLPHEMLVSDPQGFVEALGDFAELRFDQPMGRGWENPSLSSGALHFLRTWNRLFRSSRFNREPVVSVASARGMRERLQRRARPRAPVADEVSVRAVRPYVGGNDWLAERSGMALAELGYLM